MAISSFKYQQLCLLGKPKCDRAIYRLLKKNRVRSIVEFGLGDSTRTKFLLDIARKFSGTGQIRYTGIDLFDARPESETRLGLRDVHRDLVAADAKVQLVPGTLDQAIPRIANSHLRTDLILISGNYQKTELNACWTFFPRMLCATSLLLLQPPGDVSASFQTLTRMEIERIAKRTVQRDQDVEIPAAA